MTVYESLVTGLTDKQEARQRFLTGNPFPHIIIDNFLDTTFAKQVLAEFPSLDLSKRAGREFRALHEKGKIQISDPRYFPPAIEKLNNLLASEEFLSLMSFVTGIDNLLADPDLKGGGLHVTPSQGYLDVHVDFNYVKDKDWHRRLNILIYFNDGWQDSYGGNLELWDKKVSRCLHTVKPVFNRCVIFATSDISFHGVTAVNCPEGKARKSFAAYYYTKEAPEGWTGEKHTTIFKARPNEKFKRYVFMPLKKLQSSIVKIKRSLGS